MTDKTKLLIRKLVMAFVVTFVGSLVVSLSGLSQQPNYNWDKSAIIALVMAALGAAARAILALGPINLVASDKQHSLIGPKE